MATRDVAANMNVSLKARLFPPPFTHFATSLCLVCSGPGGGRPGGDDAVDVREPGAAGVPGGQHHGAWPISGTRKYTHMKKKYT